MKNVISTTIQNIRTFCKVNHISLNEEIVAVPVYEIKAFFVGRDQSGENYSEEEARKDLGNSEAFYLQLDDKTGKPAIMYDLNRMQKLSWKEQLQIFIHEFLHYNEALETLESPFSFRADEMEREAECEVISFLIASYADCDINDGLDALSENIIDPEGLVDAYGKKLGNLILRKMYTLKEDKIKKYFE